LAELVASLSLATDLGAGGSFEDALRACLTATRLAGLLGLPDEQISDIYYLPLMALVGCTSTAHMASWTLSQRRGVTSLARRSQPHVWPSPTLPM
jgi:hypothetical protein